MKDRRHKKILITTAIILCVAITCLLFHICVIPKQLFPGQTSTILLDDNGKLLSARIAKDGQWRFPQTDSVNQKFVSCLLNYEDQRFYHHWGIDPIGIIRALRHNLQNDGHREGGSTLTMQLARMARGNQPRTLWNKIVEALWAIDIECTHSKEEILNMYVSHAPFGGNIVGINAATWRYFNRDLDYLSWSEMCCLAVLPNSPALIHPGRNRTALKEKRDKLLHILQKRAIITQEELNLALEEPLPEIPYQIPNNAPHYLDFKAKTRNGEIIKTSIHSQLQRNVQQIANDYSKKYSSSNHVDNVAILVLDVTSGEPIAYVGNSTNQNTEAWQVDIIQSERSPGSTLKPFLYASMISSGEITPYQLVSDTPLSIDGFVPSNFNHTFSGAVHAHEAIIQSLNVPLVRMLIQHTLGRFMEDLKWLGMTTLHHNEDHYGVSLILGGAEITLWDLCKMYRKLSVQLQGNQVEENPRISSQAIWFAFEAMSQLNRPEEEAEWSQFRSMKNIAWKTGTSWGSRDAWAIGVTPKYIVGVWTGNATGEGRAGLTGIGYSAPIMFDIFALLDNVEWFKKPTQDMESMIVCKQSGCIASTNCCSVDTIWLPKNLGQTENCSYCKIIHLSKDQKWQVNSSCECVDDMITQSWFVLPTTQEYYYQKCHANYHKLPPLRNDCVGNTFDQLDFIYPEHGSTIIIPRGFDGSSEHIVFEAACRREHATLYWHLNDTYIGETTGTHKISVQPSIGDYTLSIVDEKGNRRAISIHIR